MPTPGSLVVVTTWDHLYYPGDLGGMEALKLYESVKGDVALGDAGAVGEFTLPTQATVQTALDEARAYWTDGAYDASQDKVVVGFSAATAWEYFESFRSDQTRSGSWQDADCGVM